MFVLWWLPAMSCKICMQIKALSASSIVGYSDTSGYWVLWECSSCKKKFENCCMQVYCIDHVVLLFRRGGDSLWKVVVALFKNAKKVWILALTRMRCSSSICCSMARKTSSKCCNFIGRGNM